ncbi:MAG: helix-turn-helix domain-containing protein [Clostridia bacterium]|nr:helix-turn-helix domain-containing protein [Clostridia bacterium]
MSYHIFDDLPDILDAAQIASALRISRVGAYNLLSSADFPTLHIGSRKLVMKNDLITWLKSHTNTTPKH